MEEVVHIVQPKVVEVPKVVPKPVEEIKIQPIKEVKAKVDIPKMDIQVTKVKEVINEKVK